MNARLEALRGLLKANNLTLSSSAELDSIQNHGLPGWTDYLRRVEKRRQHKAGKVK